MKAYKVHEHDYLNNNYVTEVPIKYAGIQFPTVEHAFQAAKSDDPEHHKAVAQADITKARELGKTCHLVDGWNEKRLSIMTYLVRQKFFSNPDLQEKLMQTNDALIRQVGPDKFWGVFELSGGQNHMGKILMDVRKEAQMINGYVIPEEDDRYRFTDDDEMNKAIHNLIETVEEEADPDSLMMEDVDRIKTLIASKCIMDALEQHEEDQHELDSIGSVFKSRDEEVESLTSSSDGFLKDLFSGLNNLASELGVKNDDEGNSL